MSKTIPGAGAQKERRATGPLDLLRDLKVGQKLALIAASLAIPLAALLYFLVADLNADLAVANEALGGAEYLTELGNFVGPLSEHYGLNNVLLSGDESVRNQVMALRAQIDAEFEVLQTFNQQYGEALGTTGILSQFIEDWQTLETALENGTLSAPEAFAAHNEILEEHLELMRTVANASNLTTDPGLDTNIVVTLSTAILPPLAEDLGVLRGRGAGFLASSRDGGLTRDEVESLALVAGAVGALTKEAAATLEDATQASPELQEVFGGLVERAFLLTDEALELADTVVFDASALTYSSTDYFATFTEAINANLEIFNIGLLHLDQALEARVAALRQNRLATLGSIVAVLVLAFLLVAWVVRQITGPVTDLSAVAERVGHGDLSKFAQVQSPRRNWYAR